MRVTAMVVLCCAFVGSGVLPAGEGAPVKLTAAEAPLRDLGLRAARADAVVLAHCGQLSPSPEATKGSAALWIDQVLKGKLNAQRDIVWLPRSALPEIAVGSERWLLALTQNGDGSWSVSAGDGLPVKVSGPADPKVADAARGVGSFRPRSADAPGEDEIALWVKKMGKGSTAEQRSSFAKLLASGKAARQFLDSALASPDEEMVSTARRLLPLVSGGEPASGLSLMLEPRSFTLGKGERRMLQVRYANQTDRDIRVVLGQSAWGENVLAAHKTHLYQRFNQAGFSHGRVAAGLATMAVLQGNAALWLFEAPWPAMLAPFLLQLVYARWVLGRSAGV